MSNQFRRVVAGSGAFFRVKVWDNTQDPEVLFNPSGGVNITIVNPSGATVVNGAGMTNASTGVYTYEHQTSTGDPKGAWLAFYHADNGSKDDYTPSAEAFLLV